MSLLDALSAYKSLLTLLVVIFGPSLLPRLLVYLTQRRHRPPTLQPPTPTPPLPLYAQALLTIHTVYLLLQLFHPPYDIFSNPAIPIFAPNAIVREALSRKVPRDPLPIQELLLSRLQKYDNRLNYARFGHAPLSDCVWCETTEDYALYSLPSALSAYLSEALLLGVLSLRIVGGRAAPLRADQWRTTFGWTISLTCIGECLVRYLYDLNPADGDCLHVSRIQSVDNPTARQH